MGLWIKDPFPCVTGLMGPMVFHDEGTFTVRHGSVGTYGVIDEGTFTICHGSIGTHRVKERTAFCCTSRVFSHLWC